MDVLHLLVMAVLVVDLVALLYLWVRMNENLKRRKALVEALTLALTAPDDDKTERASELAEKIAGGMPAITVERAKLGALERVEDV